MDAVHTRAGATLALTPAAPRSQPSPPTDILPNRQVVEGPAARGPQKSLNTSAATAPTAVTEPNRSQSPRCPCKAPPKFYHPAFRLHRRRMAPVYLSLWRSIGSNAMGKMGELATRPN